MNTWICLLFVGLNSSAAVTHSLKYFYSASSGVLNVPEFSAVGTVDGVEVFHYDSVSRTAEPRQAWMSRTTDPEYWEQETGRFSGAQQAFKANIEIAKQRFSQTGGVHMYQSVYGCDWDDVTEEVTGIYQFAYDGEDLIAFSLELQTWIPAQQQAVITKLKWDSPAVVAQKKNYLTQVCPDWLKRYVEDGRSFLLRTVPPSVSLLQKSPSSPISCFATGFYPDKAEMFWRKNGEEIHTDVDKGESLPNPDGTFQMTVHLDLSSLRDQDWSRYECVFQLSGMKDDVITKLDRAVIRTNEAYPLVPFIGAVFFGGLLVLAGCIAGFIIWRRKYNGFPRAGTSDASSVEVKVFCEDQQKMVKT